MTLNNKQRVQCSRYFHINKRKKYLKRAVVELVKCIPEQVFYCFACLVAVSQLQNKKTRRVEAIILEFWDDLEECKITYHANEEYFTRKGYPLQYLAYS